MKLTVYRLKQIAADVEKSYGSKVEYIEFTETEVRIIGELEAWEEKR